MDDPAQHADVRRARAARNAGRYDEALRGYRGAGAPDQAFDCLFELTVSRRVIDDLMADLAWSPDRYRGFEHLDAATLAETEPAGIDAAFAAATAVAGAPRPHDGWMAGELAERGAGAADIAARFAGVTTASGVGLAVARAHEREGALAAAIDALERVLAKAPWEADGWEALMRIRLARGEIAGALTNGFFAAQMRRDVGPHMRGTLRPMLRYCGHEIYFINGTFSAVAPSADRVHVIATDQGLVEMHNPLPPVVRRLYKGVIRAIVPRRVLIAVRRLVFPTHPAPIVAASPTLPEVMASIRDQVAEKRRAAP